MIYLSAGRCIDSPDGRWNVESNVIVRIVFTPGPKQKKPKHYGLDPKSFEYQGLARGHKYFKNEEKGLFFTTRKGRVSSIEKYPSKDQQDLNCERRIGSPKMKDSPSPGGGTDEQNRDNLVVPPPEKPCRSKLECKQA